MLASFYCVSAVIEEAVCVPFTALVASPARIFEEIVINWEICKADDRRIAWPYDSTRYRHDPVRFAVYMIWHPETAGALCLRSSFDCLVDGRVLPGESENVSSIGMALESALSIHLTLAWNQKTRVSTNSVTISTITFDWYPRQNLVIVVLEWVHDNQLFF